MPIYHFDMTVDDLIKEAQFHQIRAVKTCQDTQRGMCLICFFCISLLSLSVCVTSYITLNCPSLSCLCCPCVRRRSSLCPVPCPHVFVPVFVFVSVLDHVSVGPESHRLPICSDGVIMLMSCLLLPLFVSFCCLCVYFYL